MTTPSGREPLKDIEDLNNEILSFNFSASKEEQEAEIQSLANKVLKIKNELPLGTVVELGGDAATIAACAINPPDIIGCFRAIIAVIDIIKVAKQKKLT